MSISLLVALAVLVVWGALVFVVAVPSGFIHALLAVGVMLAVRAIALQDPAK